MYVKQSAYGDLFSMFIFHGRIAQKWVLVYGISHTTTFLY